MFSIYEYLVITIPDLARRRHLPTETEEHLHLGLGGLAPNKARHIMMPSEYALSALGQGSAFNISALCHVS